MEACTCPSFMCMCTCTDSDCTTADWPGNAVTNDWGKVCLTFDLSFFKQNEVNSAECF